MKHRNATRASATMMFLAAFAAAPLHCEEAKNKEDEVDRVDISSFKCKDIMRMESEDRAVAMGMLHGYSLGKQGTTTFSSAMAGARTDSLIEYCLDHPGEGALSAFEKGK
ncbi:MAG: hypothetical protein HC814_04630 [Rhodobacteraceae bacterium]|nr:hypothetical protein [Paracoccaceae bacterium]